jgi:hypothetical protein
MMRMSSKRPILSRCELYRSPDKIEHYERLSGLNGERKFFGLNVSKGMANDRYSALVKLLIALRALGSSIHDAL